MEIITLTGEISRHNQKGIWNQVDPVLERSLGSIVLDFSNVQYMAISSIAIMIDLLIQARNRSIKIAACGLSGPVMELMTLSNLMGYIEIYPDLSDAVNTIDRAG